MVLKNHDLLERFRVWTGRRRLEEQIYIVGGAVRDLLLKRPVSDVDLAVDGDCGRICRDFTRHSSARLIAVGQAFQSFRVIKAGEQLDFAPIEGVSIQEDLLRRDLTVNAMALPLMARHPEEGLLDPCNGRYDLQHGRIRMVRAANLSADPLRLLRVFRFAAELGFKINSPTLASVRVRAPELKQIAGERILYELKKILSSDSCANTVGEMAEHVVLFELIPELEASRHTTGGRPRPDVWSRTLRALLEADRIIGDPSPLFRCHTPCALAYLRKQGRRALVRLAILLLDVAKLDVALVRPDGQISFHGHEIEGAHLAADIMKRLKASRKESRTVTQLVRNHLRPLELAQTRPRPSVLVRLVREVGEDVIGLIIVGLADLKAQRQPWGQRGEETAYLDLAGHLVSAWQGLQRPAPEAPLITGNDLMKTFSLEPSGVIGDLLELVNDAVLDGLVATKEEALRYAGQILAERQNSL